MEIPSLDMGMDQYLLNIHFNPAILMWTEGVQGFDTLPYVWSQLESPKSGIYCSALGGTY